MTGRARDDGVVAGRLAPGPLNAITDVAGVLVGHATVIRDDPVVRSGVTAIWPHAGNPFRERLYAAVESLNGYGELTGSRVIDEWGLLGSPIVLTDTAHVGIAYTATVRHLGEADPGVGDVDVLIPVIGECDAGFLSDNRAFGVVEADVRDALASATAGPVREGNTGAGTGMQLFDFKGGIGTASRVIELGGEPFTVGVLLLCNHGTREQLHVLGVPVGRELGDLLPEHHREGSCIGVLATDLPLHPAQLRRLAKRIGLGLARGGAVANDGSGELFVAFSTARRIPRSTERLRFPVETIVEGQFWREGSPLDLVFEAVAEATEEAVLNALWAAETLSGRDGRVLHALPVDRTLALLRRPRIGL
ncbi:P1 family peptidase [Candidatus Solirubrobacter pratensis]|uniref:P1 family peptidase n=1 Tax=Candidatus Solirubrobacter pratensis TaxID=1298857 RepID=UPI000419E4B6|nr:P1 family peptidase [Candidatus Solirubrobacter pratensis]